jgi:hypothetical protein
MILLFFHLLNGLHPLVDEEDWIVDTDASGYALQAVLSQIQDGQERFIRYASKTLAPEQRRYCTTKRKLLGTTWALRSFRYYLQGRHCLLLNQGCIILCMLAYINMPGSS